MKIKENFALRNIAGTWVVLPLGAKTLDFTGMLTLNESGCMLWHLLEEGTTLEKMAEALVQEYEVTYDDALADVDAFVNKLSVVNCIE